MPLKTTVQTTKIINLAKQLWEQTFQVSAASLYSNEVELSRLTPSVSSDVLFACKVVKIGFSP
jgi:hypothetical protein